MAGKGDKRRPAQISREEQDRRWAEAFPPKTPRCPMCPLDPATSTNCVEKWALCYRHRT